MSVELIIIMNINIPIKLSLKLITTAFGTWGSKSIKVMCLMES